MTSAALLIFVDYVTLLLCRTSSPELNEETRLKEFEDDVIVLLYGTRRTCSNIFLFIY